MLGFVTKNFVSLALAMALNKINEGIANGMLCNLLEDIRHYH